MSRIAYVNGRYVPHGAAVVSIDDRGYVFADGVYEVVAVERGQLVDEAAHLARLKRSLAELRIMAPMEEAPLRHVLRQVVKRNGIKRGMVYLQITRGVAPRDHGFPTAAWPQLVVTAKRLAAPSAKAMAEGVGIVTIPDIRWRRCDIKSVSLLPNILGKQVARDQGAHEAWQIDDQGQVTEGTSSNAWIVSADGVLLTRPSGDEILNGITRLVVLELVAELGLPFEQRAFGLEEARVASEAFLTSTTAHVLPITRIDGQPVGDGKPGRFTTALAERYRRHLDQAR
ncbi:MAG TPA: D-amino-acid transaminase [Stellaceae bacterium]|nr:D-amino-acid transaminase [Stellaceae bacterium]